MSTRQLRINLVPLDLEESWKEICIQSSTVSKINLKIEQESNERDHTIDSTTTDLPAEMESKGINDSNESQHSPLDLSAQQTKSQGAFSEL